jgi:uncharacterized RDD family membrane protein YckC
MKIYEQHTKIATAGFIKRLLAGIIDFIIIFILVYLGKIITFVKLPGLETTCTVYYCLCLIYCGTTIGGKILGIYTIKNNGNKLSKVRSVLKSAYIFSFLLIGIIIWSSNFVLPDSTFLLEPTIALILGIILFISLPMVFNKNKRSVIDLFSGTKVVCIHPLQINKWEN